MIQVQGTASSGEFITVFVNGQDTAGGTQADMVNGTFNFTVTVPAGILVAGTNTVQIQNTFDSSCVSNTETIVFDPTPTLTSVTATPDCGGGIVVTGTSQFPGAEVTIYATNQTFCNTCTESCVSTPILPAPFNPVTASFASAVVKCKAKHK